MGETFFYLFNIKQFKLPFFIQISVFLNGLEGRINKNGRFYSD